MLSSLETHSCCPPLSAAPGLVPTVLPEPVGLLEADKGPEPDCWGPSPSTADSLGSSAYSQEGDRPYGLVSIDTVIVVDAEKPCTCPCTCEEDSYPALNLDAGLEPGLDAEDPLLRTKATVLSCGCVAAGGPARLGGHLGSLFDKLKLPFENEAGWVPGPPWGGGLSRGGVRQRGRLASRRPGHGHLRQRLRGLGLRQPCGVRLRRAQGRGAPEELRPPVGGHGPAACRSRAPGQLDRPTGCSELAVPLGRADGVTGAVACRGRRPLVPSAGP